jgi:hypothetical protein
VIRKLSTLQTVDPARGSFVVGARKRRQGKRRHMGCTVYDDARFRETGVGLVFIVTDGDE